MAAVIVTEYLLENSRITWVALSEKTDQHDQIWRVVTVTYTRKPKCSIRAVTGDVGTNYITKITPSLFRAAHIIADRVGRNSPKEVYVFETVFLNQ